MSERGEPGAYKVVQPPDEVRRKVTWNPFLSVADMEKRGEENMSRIHDDARIQLGEELSRLDRVLKRVATAEIPADDLREIGRLANDVRTLADSFRFEAIVHICTAVIRFITQPPQDRILRHSVIAAFSNAIHVLRPSANHIGREDANMELARAVNAMVRKTSGTRSKGKKKEKN